jgi:hypothetical protein
MNNLNITSTFKLVFSTVVGLTLLSGSTSVWLSFQEHLSPEQTRIFESCSTTWQMGTGAVFGLLGGKAADGLHQEEEEEEEK